MSKKIDITIPNKVRPNLVSLFHKYLSNKCNEVNNTYDDFDYEDYEDIAAYWDRIFPGWDDDLLNDGEGEILFPMGKHCKSHGKRGKSKHKHSRGKAKLIDITRPYDGEEEDYNFDDVDFDFTKSDDEIKEIWFYNDYHDKEDRLEFNSYGDFKDFCNGMGYYIPKEVSEDISWRYESHCCLCPESEKIGLMEVISGHSYGAMFYDACEEDEL